MDHTNIAALYIVPSIYWYYKWFSLNAVQKSLLKLNVHYLSIKKSFSKFQLSCIYIIPIKISITNDIIRNEIKTTQAY